MIEITSVHEYLSYGAIREHGVPTARVGFARVAVNGQSAESVETALAGLAASEKQTAVPAPGDVGTMDGCRAAVCGFRPGAIR